jgi:hypothetical protein
MEYRIRLTPAQADHAGWAIDPMADMFADQLADGELAEIPTLPTLAGRTLVITDDVAVLEDILYRLEKQLPDMAGHTAGFESDQQLRGSIRAAQALAGKIRAATGFTGEAR